MSENFDWGKPYEFSEEEYEEMLREHKRERYQNMLRQAHSEKKRQLGNYIPPSVVKPRD